MQNLALSNYLNSQEWILSKVYFDYAGQRFQGRGVLRWSVDNGFLLEAPLDERLKEQIIFRNRLIGTSDQSSIRMHIKNGGIAVSTNIILSNRYDICSENRISIHLNKVTFLNRRDYDFPEKNNWHGQAIYACNGKIDRLLDCVQIKQNIEIQGCSLETHSIHQRGIYFQGDSGSEVVIYMLDKQYLHCTWKIAKTILTKSEATRFFEAIQYSLSILTGNVVCLLQYEAFYGCQIRREVRINIERSSLEYFRLFPDHLHDEHILKDFFYKFSISLAKKEKEALICKNIFLQMVDASAQKNAYIMELLISTTLEAILRNIDNQPFNSGGAKWNVGCSLHAFLKKYFDSCYDIDSLKVKIMKAHSSLRDRNAHPDWLFTQGGNLSKEQQEKSFDNMIFLANFYGYIILALLGFQDIQLKFPMPISQWGAILTITPSSK